MSRPSLTKLWDGESLQKAVRGTTKFTKQTTCRKCGQTIRMSCYSCVDCTLSELKGGSFDICHLCYHSYSENDHRQGHRFTREQIFQIIPTTEIRKTSCAETLQAAFFEFKKRPLLGIRKRSLFDSEQAPALEERLFGRKQRSNSDPNAREHKGYSVKPRGEASTLHTARQLVGDSEFEWLTYEDLYGRTMDFKYGLVSLCNLQKGDYVGICGRNCVEWCLTDWATIFCGAVSVPIQFTMEKDAIVHIINVTKMKVFVFTSDLSDKILDAINSNCGSLEYAIEISYNQSLSNSTGISDIHTKVKYIKFRDVVEKGVNLRPVVAEKHQIVPKQLDDIGTIVFTSGSSGRPKGIIVTDYHQIFQISHPVTHPHEVVVFHPLAYSPSRCSLYETIGNGGKCVLYLGTTMDKLIDELRMFRPTFMNSTPALWNAVASQFHFDLSRSENDFKTASDKLDENEKILIRKQVLRKYSNFFGNRLRSASSGGAAISRDVVDLMREIFQIRFNEGYGATEVGIISIENHIPDGVDIVLKDIPELDYFHPRGEVCVHSQWMTPGYFGDEELNRDSFIHQGGKRYFRTGDIGELQSDGTLKLIDRMKFIFKLSQGEFVSPRRLELIYEESDFIQDIFVTGITSKSYVVAVIVPHKKMVMDWATSEFKTDCGSFGDVCKTPNLEDKLRSEILYLAKLHKLRSFEIPRTFHVEPQPFTMERNLRSSAQKKLRMSLSKYYGEVIEDLYSSAAGHLQKMSDFKERVNQFRKIPSLNSLLVKTLMVETPGSACGGASGGADVFLDVDKNLSDFGIDSLSAAFICNLIQDTYKVRISVPALLQLQPLRVLEDYIWKSVNGNIGQFTVPANGIGIDWKQETSLPLDFPEKPESKDCEVPPHVLLTGATGFLGAFLLKELLRHPSYKNSKIYCLVRIKNKAIQELKESIKLDLRHLEKALKEQYNNKCYSYAAQLQAQINKKRSDLVKIDTQPQNSILATRAFSRLEACLANLKILDDSLSSRVEVIVGNLSLPRLGLKKATYSELSSKIGVIIHNAALVNGVLPYFSHRDANVTGTLSILRFAFTSVPKRLHYVSTLGVLSRTGQKEEPLELEEIIPSSQSQSIGGYTKSKQVAEYLVCLAAARGMDVNIYRPSDIGGDTLTGCGNVNDFLTMIICGIIHLKCYPQDYTGLPRFVNMTSVDYISKALIHISQQSPVTVSSGKEVEFPHIFHMCQQELLGIEEISSFLESYGYSLEAVSVKEWKKRVTSMSPDNPVYLLKESLIVEKNFQHGVFSCQNTTTACESVGIKCKQITEDIYRKYLDFFVDQKLIDAPFDLYK